MMLLGVALYWIESLFYELEGMQPLVLPLAALAVRSRAFPGLVLTGAHAQAAEFKLHLALAMLAYGLFVIALLHATLMAVLEQQLHRKGTAAFRQPAAAPHAGKLLFRMIAAAFVFLTLTLVTGIAFSETLFGRALTFDHKTVFAMLVAHFRPAACRALALRLARAHRAALDALRLRHAAPRLRRQPLRARSRARTRLNGVIAWNSSS